MAAKKLRAARSTIPSVDRLLIDPAFEPLIRQFGRIRVRDAIRDHLSAMRARWNKSNGKAPTAEGIARAVAGQLETQAIASIRAVINLSGTVLHTNLGRALLPESAIDSIAAVARAPCNLEFDLDEGERGERDAHVEGLVARLTGAEAAVIVNNNAAAVLLAINSLAMRREVIVSRGELIEIGGSFRLPEIMARAGCRLREVGTTNRTHLKDYAEAMSPRTALVLKAHTSNFKIEGFVASPEEKDLSKLCRERGIPFVVDLGSGTLVDLRRHGLPHEPTPAQALGQGADLVTFSGDKLLGGPQAGVIAGRKDLVEKIRKNPLKRALRLDKLTIAALSAVLRLYEDPDRLTERLPTLRLLSRPVEEIRAMAQRLKNEMEKSFTVEIVDCESQVGSGAAPGRGIPSAGLALRPGNAKLAERFRRLPIPVIGRLQDGAFILDFRCLEDEEQFVRNLSFL